ncbi:MAG: penicillin-binding protein [Clostridiales bacterium]|nr:penicillin-binding protein [Clostridiales bacterium]
MRRIAKRGVFIWILIVLFIAGLLFMTGSLVANADDWVMKRNNRHIYSNGELIAAGTVYDRNDVELAWTQNGERVYNSDPTIRKATLHAVGDPTGFIATGVQSVYDAKLTGYGLVNGVYSIKRYGSGNNITLNLDSEVCAVAYNALGGKKGTIGVYNYKTGEILCMVSSPTYDVANPPAISDDDSNYEGVYINRLITGLYTPGSTFKTVVAACAIDNLFDVSSRTWTCTGSYQASGGEIICNAVHGTVDFESALAKSCNCAFAQIAIEVGRDALSETVESVGLTSRVTIDDVTSSQGRFSTEDTTDAALGWIGIGQGTTMVSPVQMMRYMGAIANEGTAVTPTLVKNIRNQVGIPVSFSGGKETETLLSASTANTLKQMMRNNVTQQYGDGNYSGLNLCAKSGTAQIDGKESTAWFTGFLDDDEHPYAFVVVIEEGGSGSQVAGPAANKVLQALVSKY